MRIYFDVGAHDGLTSIPLIRSGEFDYCYAFEINPRSLQELKSNIAKFKLEDKYTVIEKAVSSQKGNMSFYVFNKSNVGSLFKPTKGTLEKRFKDFGGYNTIEVEVTTLESVCTVYDVKQIDFLHTDTQGNDYEVLKGLGNYIKIVRAGEVEVMNNDALYEHVTNSDHACRTFLEENGFTVTTPRRTGEYDLKFTREK